MDPRAEDTYADLFNEVFDLLVADVSARPAQREEFLRHHLALRDRWQPSEFRFQGSLGFGGKFWCEMDHLRVSCYAEDQTATRKRAMWRTNEKLEPFTKKYQELAVRFPQDRARDDDGRASKTTSSPSLGG